MRKRCFKFKDKYLGKKICFNIKFAWKNHNINNIELFSTITFINFRHGLTEKIKAKVKKNPFKTKQLVRRLEINWSVSAKFISHIHRTSSCIQLRSEPQQ